MIQFFASLGYLATFYVLIFGVLSSAMHLIFAGVRTLRGRSPCLKWIVAARAFAVLGCLAWFLAALLVLVVLELFNIAAVEKEAVAKIVVLVGVIPLFVLPVALPLYEIWRYQKTSSLMLAAASVIAFPVVVACTANFSYQAAVAAQFQLAGGVTVSGYPDAALYAFRPRTTPKAERIRRMLGMPELVSSALTPAQFEVERAALWFEISLNDVCLEWLNDAGWHFTQVEFNTDDNEVVEILPFFYRLAYAGLFWAVVFILISRISRSTIHAVRRHANATA